MKENERLLPHYRLRRLVVVCFILIATCSLLSLYYNREEDRTDDNEEEEDNQRTTVLSSPYCDHLWSQDNFSSMANVIQRSHILSSSFPGDDDRHRFSVLGDHTESSRSGHHASLRSSGDSDVYRSRLNEMRIESLLQRMNSISDNGNVNENDMVFKVVVLGNSMTAGVKAIYLLPIYPPLSTRNTLTNMTYHSTILYIYLSIHLSIYYKLTNDGCVCE